MNIAFFGSPQIAATILEKLHERFPVSLVVSQPDRPVGRKQILTPTPVSQYAIQNNIPLSRERQMIRTIGLLEEHSIDIAVVVAYGEILKKEVLDTPQYGFINVHYSLLPKYRGASPVQGAILAGEPETGITIMQMDEELDHGDILSMKTVPIEQSDTTASMLSKLTDSAIPLLLELIAQFTIANPKPQHHAEATLIGRLNKQDGYIELSTLNKALNGQPISTGELPSIQQKQIRSHDHPAKQDDRSAQLAHNFIRAMYPWPGAWTTLPNGGRIKLLESTCSEDRLILKKIQREGKTPVVTSITGQDLLAALEE